MHGKIKGVLTIDEMRRAEHRLIKVAQNHFYHWKFPNVPKMILSTSQALSDLLCPYLKCRVHVGGRLKESEVVNTNSSIISGSHPIAKAIIMEMHARAHLGTE